MNFHVLTLFPDMIEQGICTSITGRAIDKGLIGLNTVNIRDYAGNKYGQVDDYPYGGGAGMVMQPGPVYRSYEAVVEEIGYRPRVVYLTPQGRVFNQDMAEDFSKEKDLVFLCGHYEGIDEGVLNNDVSAEFESFHDNLLEYPQYTRPAEFMGREVPPILLSGNHPKVDQWRREQSIFRTMERRPDLMESANLTKEDIKFIKKLKKNKE